MASVKTIEVKEENAVRKLLNLAQNVKNWDKPRDLENYVKSESTFGQRGDNLLHILIQRENPSNEMGRKTRRDPNKRERNNSLWMDMPPESAMPSRAPNRQADMIIPGIPVNYPMISTMAMMGSNKDSPQGSFRSGKIDIDRERVRQKGGRESPRDASQSNIRSNDLGTDAGLGRRILVWMLQHPTYHKYFTSLPSAPSGKSVEQEMLPVHLAMAKNNLAFLACFLGLFCDPEVAHRRGYLNTILEQVDRRHANDGNCVHNAISLSIPFASCFVALCSREALLKTDRDDCTPMHCAMGRAKKGLTWIPPQPASFAKYDKAPRWDDMFDPARIFDEILERNKSDTDNLMANILTKVNKEGKSPLQERCSLQQNADESQLANRMKATIFDTVKGISDVSTALYGTTGSTKELYLNMSDFNQAALNFQSFVDKLTDQPRFDDDVIAFEETLFFVHLPDLNYVKQPCPHDTIRKLFTWLRRRGVKTIKTLRIPDNTTTPLSEAFVQKYILDVFHIESLDWRKLDVNLGVFSYSTGDPYSSGIDPPTANERRKASALVDLTLYSSGNWSVLYHWMSKDGLAMLPKPSFNTGDTTQLRSTRINIIQLDPMEGVYDLATHDRHLELTKAYKKRMDEIFLRSFEDPTNTMSFIPDIKIDVTWDYPLPPHESEESSTQTVKHQFTAQLQATFSALRVLEAQSVRTGNTVDFEDVEGGSRSGSVRRFDSNASDDYNDDRTNGRNGYHRDDHYDSENENSKWEREQELFQEYALEPLRPDLEDKRIRVAIIDNGADRIRSRFRDMIAKGQSYVTADELHTNQPLPWWMVSDPHGTQMASLISQVNKYCRLYIARVGTLRNDIRADSAANAIKWAIKHNVDVISISWTLPEGNAELESAIIEAAQKRILIFCSTADEGIYSEAYPVGYKEHVISVSATDQHGHLTSKTRTDSPVDVLIPGDNLRAAGPAYIGNVSSSVSGSSVATALAAGIASLALVLLRTFNCDYDLPTTRLPRETSSNSMPQRHDFLTKEGMLKVFRRMGPADKAVLLYKMFPQDSRDDNLTLEALAKLWQLDNWKADGEAGKSK